MTQVDREQLVSNVERLQKITRSLERSSARIDKSNDTTIRRVSVESIRTELQEGVNLVTAIQSADKRIREQSIDAQADKLLQQYEPFVHKFEKIKSSIDSKFKKRDELQQLGFIDLNYREEPEEKNKRVRQV